MRAPFVLSVAYICSDPISEQTLCLISILRLGENILRAGFRQPIVGQELGCVRTAVTSQQERVIYVREVH